MYAAQVHPGWYNEFRALLREIQCALPAKCYYNAYSYEGLELILFDHCKLGLHRGFPGLMSTNVDLPIERHKVY